jgi:hypothetical protein
VDFSSSYPPYPPYTARRSHFTKHFLKTTPAPPKKSLHQKSQSRSCFRWSRSPNRPYLYPHTRRVSLPSSLLLFSRALSPPVCSFSPGWQQRIRTPRRPQLLSVVGFRCEVVAAAPTRARGIQSKGDWHAKRSAMAADGSRRWHNPGEM